MVTNKTRTSRTAIARHLHQRILIQIALFIVITVAMFGIVITDAVTSHLNLWWILLGAIIGIILGYVVGRAFRLSWHEDSQKVIMNVDRTGFIVIILYVLIRALVNSEAGNLLSGIELLAVTYSLLGGIMIGRLASMGRRIVRMLRDQQIL